MSELFIDSSDELTKARTTSETADGKDASLGAKADTAATTDIGTFSLISLFKRLLSKTPALGPATKAVAVPVTMATDQPDINTKITARVIRESQVGSDQDLTWANSDAANTQKTYQFTKPATNFEEYELIVYNPSTVTDITIKIFAVELALKAGTRNSFITSFSIPKSQTITGTVINTYSKFIHGIFNGGDCLITASNDTILGGGDAFLATLRLREVM